MSVIHFHKHKYVLLVLILIGGVGVKRNSVTCI